MAILSVDDLSDLLARHAVNGDLAKIMVAAALLESGGDTDAVGDSGHSIGLFQLHDHGLGAGLSVQQRQNPDFVTDRMEPIFAAAEFLSPRRSTPGPGGVGLGVIVRITGAGGLKVHDAPGLNAPSSREMTPQDTATVVGGPESADGRVWWQVLVNDQVGWASGAFLAPVAPEDDGPLDPSVLEPRQWIALNAAITSDPGARSVARYDAVIDQFGVERNPRYAPHSGLTFCNIFVSDVTRAVRAPIPHRVNAAGAPDDGGGELTCGGMAAWLHTHGQAEFGWQQVGTAAAALAAANQGRPAVVITPRGVTHDEEHTAIIRAGDLDPELGPDIAQAGRRCVRRIRLGTTFSGRPREFWVHA